MAGGQIVVPTWENSPGSTWGAKESGQTEKGLCSHDKRTPHGNPPEKENTAAEMVR